MMRKILLPLLIGAILITGSLFLLIANKGHFPNSTQHDQKDEAVVTTLVHRDNPEDKSSAAIDDSKKVAETFAKSYLTLYPKHFDQFLSTVQPISDDYFYGALRNQRPSETNVSYEILSLQMTPLDDILDHRKTWQLIAAVKEKKDSGVTNEKQVVFKLFISQKSIGWVISGGEVSD